MARKANFYILGACIALAACGGGGSGGTSGPGDLGPGGLIGEWDETPPFGIVPDVSVPVLSSNQDGVSTTTFVFSGEAEGSYFMWLSGTRVEFSEADLIAPAASDPGMGTIRKSYRTGRHEIEVHLGEDVAGRDLFLLVEDHHDPLSVSDSSHYLVFGDDTETLPSGTANFTGGFTARLYDRAGVNRAPWAGSSAINVNFGAGDVAVMLTRDEFILTGTGTIEPGTSRYSGAMTNTSGNGDFSGDFSGGFFGAGAQGTAGTFHVADTTAPDGPWRLTGAFTGYRPSP